MCFSNYTDIIPYKGKYAVYNKINGALILLNSDNITKNIQGRWLCTSNEATTLQYLESNLFFVTDDYVQNMIRIVNYMKEDYNDVTLVISTTEQCNCSCKYCYQLNWPHTEALPENDYKKWILEYINKIFSESDKNARITIKYFGGEPLLKLNFIADLNSEIASLIRQYNKQITVLYEMDSNCTLLTKDIFGLFDNLSIATTLSLPDDHNTLRSNSFQQVVNNLLSVSDMFKMPQYQLNIGYNAHHGNISDFRNFLEFIKNLNIQCKIYVSNIVNYKMTEFTNYLNENDFEQYYCNSIVPNLLEYGYPADILPRYGIYRKCVGINSLSRKFFSDGTQTLCSFFPKRFEKNSTDYPNQIESYNYLNSLPEKCVKCYDFPYCGGARPCVHCNGVYPLKEAMRNRIKVYLDLVK